MTPSVLAVGNLVRERYEIEALIGQGGMGAVYRVTDVRLPGRRCALKVMRIPVSDLPGVESEASRDVQAARGQFLAEASTLARLDHPNLPKVSDYFTLDVYDCLVMDYVPGHDLLQRVQEARREGHFLPEDEVLAWADQLCDVLLYLHGQQPPIIHGDVKPANIKVTADGRVKLVDFGLARPGNPDDPRTLTGSGLRGLGSLPYAALEQYAGSARCDLRSDLYSLGATLYHLTTNQVPAGAHERFLEAGILAAPRQLNPSLSAAFERAILAAMQVHPKDRPATVTEWRRLLPAAGPVITTAETSTSGSKWAQLWAENRWYAAIVLVLLIAALTLTFLS